MQLNDPTNQTIYSLQSPDLFFLQGVDDMKLRSKWAFVILVLMALCISGWTVLGQRQGAASTQWEYAAKLVPSPPEDSPTIFAELGAQGWELVAVNDGRAYFKRQKK